MWSYVPKLHVPFLSNSLTQPLSYFHIELYLRCFGGPGSACDNVRFINDVKKLIFCRLLKYKSL